MEIIILGILKIVIILVEIFYKVLKKLEQIILIINKHALLLQNVLGMEENYGNLLIFIIKQESIKL